MSGNFSRHGFFSSTFRRRILHGGYIAWRIIRGGTLKSPAGWSFDPSAEGAMTNGWQLLALRSDLSSILVSPSCQRTSVLVRVVTHSAVVV